jgi:Tol biopolymer transport system component
MFGSQKLIVILVWIGLSLLLFSCKEKKGTEDVPAYCAACEPCERFYLPESPIPYPTRPLPIQRYSPCFNPNNGNEFVYVHQDLEAKTTMLIKYNLLTQQQAILLPQVGIVEQPNWGVNGWIVFSNGKNIYKVRDNGDSLTQLTFEYTNQQPNVFGDKILYTTSEGPTGSAGISIIDMQGNKVEDVFYSTLGVVLKKNVINGLGEIAGSLNRYKLGAYHLTTKKLEVFLSNDTGYYQRIISDKCWHPNNTDIYFIAAPIGGNDTTRLGINKINKRTQQETLIKNVCATRAYYYVSISPDGKKLLVERENVTLVENYTRLVGSDIYIMDIDGRNEKKVFP